MTQLKPLTKKKTLWCKSIMIPEMKLAAECSNDVSHGDFKS